MDRPKEFVNSLKAEFPEDRLTYQKAIATFHPESAEEAAQFLKLANKQRQKIYITGFGNNIDPLGEPFESMVVLRTDRLNDMIEVSEENYFIKVGTGFPLREVNIRLKEKSLWLPHSALPYVGSVGGAIAVNLSADLHGHDVPIKKYFIQSEIVTPEGEIITPGSVCFKSVSGFDIVKIFAPSWGLLGLVVSAAFRVMPISGAAEFDSMTMHAVDREHFLSGLDEANKDADAVYSRKIKAKFDPAGILPVV
ncbi:MAG: FAD-binding oxidoreductase [bacterium]|nr:FAD-binding oxidoreductase [bacterium]